MGKDPAFLFYTNDYLGGTMGFSFEQHGAYLIMLLYQFNNGPFSDDTAISIIGKIWDTIQHKFKRKTGSGLRYNEKLETVIEQRKNFLTSRRESAMKRWNKNDKPLSDTKIDDMHTQCIRNAHAMRMGNGNGDGNKDGNKEENKEEILLSPQYRISKKLYQGIIKNGSTMKPPDLFLWSEEIKKLHDIDGKPWDLINKIMQAALEDNFWKSILKSTRKLRQHILAGKFDKFIPHVYRADEEYEVELKKVIEEEKQNG
jgi:hypothetical protein